MAARCNCCDLPVDWCGKKAETRHLALESAELLELRKEPGVIESRWTTRCPVCDDRIRPGQLIRPSKSMVLSWQHAWAGDCR